MQRARQRATGEAILPAPLTRSSLARAVQELAARDAGLARIVAQHGEPPLWARPQSFATLARIILEQQVSVQSAATLYARVVQGIGAMEPGTVLAVGEDGLREHGLTRQKARYVVALAGQIDNGTLALRGLARRPDDEVRVLLTAVPGIGPWSASIYQLMALRRPDVWPPGDLALHVAVQRLRGLPALPSSTDAERMAEAWTPWRAVAARILWHGYLEDRTGRRSPTPRALPGTEVRVPGTPETPSS